MDGHETAVSLLGVTVTEPATAATDLALLVVCLAAAWRLCPQLLWSRRWWGFAFAWLALAFGGAAIDHGLSHYVVQDGAIWRATLAANAAAATCVVLSVARGQLGGPIGTSLPWIAVPAAATYLVYMWTTDASFRGLLYYLVPTHVLLLVASIRRWSRRRTTADRALAAGVLLSFAGAAYQQLGPAPHQWFNHNDVYHLIELAALLLLYRGAARLEDLAPRTACDPRSLPTWIRG